MSDCLPVCLLGLFWTPRSLIRSPAHHTPSPYMTAHRSVTRAFLLNALNIGIFQISSVRDNVVILIGGIF
jgi:hypothetical protein